MQITLVQTEIEQSIRDYINSVLQVQPGHEIDIDLRATRGPEGFQAVVDINPTGSKTTSDLVEPPAAEEPVKTSTAEPLGIAAKTRAPRTPKAAAPVAAEAAPEADAAPAQDAEPAQEKAAPVDSTNAAESVQDAENAANDTVEAPVKSLFGSKPEQAAEETPPASSGTSLFGNLKRPVNS